MSSRIQSVPLPAMGALPAGPARLHRGIQIVRCRVCGRRLSAPGSVRAGIGPVCALGATGRAAARLLGPMARIRVHRNEDPTEALERLGLGPEHLQAIDLSAIRDGIGTISLICENLAASRPGQRPRLELAGPYVAGLNSVLHENLSTPELPGRRRAQAVLYSLGALAHYLNVLGGLNETDVAHHVVGALSRSVDQVIDGSNLRRSFDAALRREMIEEQNQGLPLFDLPQQSPSSGPKRVTLPSLLP